MNSIIPATRKDYTFRYLLLALAYLLLSAAPGFPQILPDQAQKVIGANSYDSLSSKARNRGEVKVIVKVSVPFQDLSTVSKTQAMAEMAMISHVQGKVMQELAGHRVTHLHNFTYVPYIAMTVDEAALNALLGSTGVISVEEDIPVPPTLDLSVPRIGASDLHSAGYDGSGVAVAIIDTGVDQNHPFLAGSVVSEACYSTTYLPFNSTSVCPAGGTDSTAAGSAVPYGGNCPPSECDHGTHVAGIAAGGAGVPGSPGPGVAPGASVIAIQVFSRFDDDTLCGGSSPCVLTFSSDQMKGLERVYALKDTFTIAAVNMSIGGGKHASNCDTDSRKSAIDNLRAAGIATIIASGNSSSSDGIGAPACISTAISVGATTDADAVASYSDSASLLTLLAPGSSITSSVPGGTYQSWNGTSMAAPHVTGAWALMRQAKPGASVTTIQNAFTSTGLSITDPRNGVTKQRINVYEALNSFYPVAVIGVVAGDFNNDGYADLAGLNSAGNIFYTTNLSTWVPVPGILTSLVVGDFNNDGYDDLAGLNSAGNIFFTTNLSTWFSIPGILTSLVVGDFNNDGYDDLAGLNSAGNIFYTTNMATWVNIPGILENLVVGDFDRDGADELAGLNSAGYLFYTPDMINWVNMPGILENLVVGDFDRDGADELAGLNPAGYIFYTPDMINWVNVPGILSTLTAGDFDNDGADELAGLNPEGYIFYTTDMTTWITVPGILENLVVGDFDRDGADELAGLNSAGYLFYTSDMINWVNVPGVL